MYRKSVFLYISRLSCIGKQLFVYMRGSTGIPEVFFQRVTEEKFRRAIIPHALPARKMKMRQSVGNMVGNKKRELAEKLLTP
ncbi:MAG: hypothetical protein D3906_16745 [Candidatus Electrothrix sp. AUS1_2]|nr:hypothetical protein [Candidatus Electrothrix sp. AUS1_2]